MRTLAAVLVCLSSAAAAQEVSMSGRLGDKALLMIDGSPRTVAVGSTVQGVKLVSVKADEAVLEIAGKRVAVRLGGAQVSLGSGGAGDGGGSKIVLTASSGGHFVTSGQINGRAVEFVVDTGATSIAMSQSDAERIGLKYKDGRRGFVGTANGDVTAYRTTLTSVRVGEVMVYNVEAIVLPAQMPYILLGNSFLTRFSMKRDGDVMTLEKRP